MDRVAPEWLLAVLADLAEFALQNGHRELYCDLERLRLKHSGHALDASLLGHLIQASFSRSSL